MVVPAANLLISWEFLPPEQKVGGSNPLGRTKKSIKYRRSPGSYPLKRSLSRIWRFGLPGFGFADVAVHLLDGRSYTLGNLLRVSTRRLQL
jgi:hypothetical protein